MRIVVTPAYSFLTGRVSAQAGEALKKALSFYRRGYFHTWEYQAHKWNGMDCVLWQNPDGTLLFPAGLTPRVVDVLAGFSGEIAIDETALRGFPALPPQETIQLPDGTSLYPDQVRVVNTIEAKLRGLLACAPNFGKTEVACALAALHPTLRMVYLLDGKELLRQTVERFERRLRERIGRVGDGAQFVRERIVIATVQTLKRRLNNPEIAECLHRAEILVADEIHGVTLPTWVPALASCPAKCRIGMSGSVKDAGRLLQEAFFGPVIAEVREHDLVELGRSADLTVLMPRCPTNIESYDLEPSKPAHGRHRRNDARRAATYYKQAYWLGIVKNDARTQMLLDIYAWAAAHGLPALGLYYRLDHLQEHARGLIDRGLTIRTAHGGTPSFVVNAAKRDLMDGKFQVLLASTIFNKGVDLPELRVVVNAAGWKSQLATRQKGSRASRRKGAGLNKALVFDPYDYGNSTLTGHASKRGTLYRSQGYPVHMTEGLPAALAEAERVLGLADPTAGQDIKTSAVPA